MGVPLSGCLPDVLAPGTVIPVDVVVTLILRLHVLHAMGQSLLSEIEYSKGMIVLDTTLLYRTAW